MKLAPLLFRPKLVPKVWGGGRLKDYGKDIAPGQNIGESWDIFDGPRESALVAGGPWQGQTLHALMKEFGPALLGASGAGAPYFPLMVKLIDANESLSVQVHPDDAQAASMVGPGESGKTEMWVVLEAQSGAKVTAGLREGVSQEGFLGALRAGNIDSVLNEFPVKKGDIVFVPAGRVHAIGKGCLIAEVQQNSDITWRLHDYGRLENGSPRELHLDQALRCVRFDAPMASMPSLVMPRKISAAEERLVESPYFTVSRLTLRSDFRPQIAQASFHLLTCLGDPLRIAAGETALELSKGATALVPASLSWHLEPLGPACQALWSRP